MREPIFFKRDDCLHPDDALYWKDLLYRVVKIGTELEFAFPKGTRKDDVLPSLVEKLAPSGDINRLGQFGVLDITSEHCGAEIRVIGRQPHFGALQRQFRQIFGLLPKGIRARPTCGLHFHVIGVGLSEAMPEIVLANVWNLTRRYAPELRFLSSCGTSREALCRRRNHCSHLEMVRWTSGTHRMAVIQKRLHDSIQVPEHQNFLNLEHVEFEPDGSVRTLHYENRFPDADLTATSIVAKVFLFLAILLKAVELSQHGVIHVGRITEWQRKVDLLNRLSNGDGPLATSDTSGVDDEALCDLRAGARELLELLKPVFGRFARAAAAGPEDHPAFSVLGILAETPVSLLRSERLSWDEIETYLDHSAGSPGTDLDLDDHRLIRLIELAQVSERRRLDDWKLDAARALLVKLDDLDLRLERLDRWRGLRWDSGLGSMVFLG